MMPIQLALISSFYVFFLSSCGYVSIPGSELNGERTFIVQNVSGYPIRIESYLTGEKIEDISIKNAEIYTKIEKTTPKQNGINGKNIFSNLNGGYRDSVLIIFDEKKAILYHCPDINRNFVTCDDDIKNIVWMGRSEYQVGRGKVNLKSKTSYDKFCYPITKEDYANAIAIEDLKK